MGKPDIFEFVEENTKLFTGIWIKDNMLGLRKFKAMNWQTAISNICIFYFPRECEKKITHYFDSDIFCSQVLMLILAFEYLEYSLPKKVLFFAKP